MSKLTTGANPIGNCNVFVTLKERRRFSLGVSPKLRPVHFYRVLHCYLPVKKCRFSSMGRIFFEGSAGLRSGVRARIVFFHSGVKNCVISLGVLQKMVCVHFHLFLYRFLLAKKCVFSSARRLFSNF